MGKVLIIKDADFSRNAVSMVTIWEKVVLKDGGWLPNYNSGKLSVGSNADLWASKPVSIDGLSKIYGHGVGDGSYMRVMFYSGLPSSETSEGLYISKIRQPQTSEETAVDIPDNAKYAVFFDEGDGVSSIATNGEYYIS